MARPAIDRLAQELAANGLNLQPGRRIGAYTIVRQLGFGGAGEVWRAKDERLGRDVAIKVLLPHLSTDAEKLRRFAEEARAAGTLNHPNILPSMTLANTTERRTSSRSAWRDEACVNA